MNRPINMIYITIIRIYYLKSVCIKITLIDLSILEIKNKFNFKKEIEIISPNFTSNKYQKRPTSSRPSNSEQCRVSAADNSAQEICFCWLNSDRQVYYVFKQFGESVRRKHPEMCPANLPVLTSLVISRFHALLPIMASHESAV